MNKNLLTVVALGGNALLRRGEPLDAAGQLQNIEKAVRSLSPLLATRRLVLTHGNGPQVGLLASTQLKWPLDVLDAETAGMIGFQLEQALANALPGTQIATLVTRVEVNEDDSAFGEPEKFIGPGMDDREANELSKSKNWTFKRDTGKLRRVVASPRPISIPSLTSIRTLVDNDTLVICMGGGGIPFIPKDGRSIGVEAVVDKDLASSLLARELHADELVLLTDVPAVYTDFGKPSQKAIRAIGADKVIQILQSFPAGSMKPKIEAAVEFVRALRGKRALIGGLEDAADVINGKMGTAIDLEPRVEFWESCKCKSKVI